MVLTVWQRVGIGGNMAASAAWRRHGGCGSLAARQQWRLQRGGSGGISHTTVKQRGELAVVMTMRKTKMVLAVVAVTATTTADGAVGRMATTG